MKRRLALTMAIAAGTMLLAAAPPASAVQFIQGFTWYSDGTFSKTGPSGTVISVFATSASANSEFDLLVAPIDSALHGCVDFDTTAVNPNVRTSNSRGFIATTAGPINRPPGQYQICFYERVAGASGGHRSGTYPVFFTVT